MKIGQIVIIGISVAIVGLMGYMLLSTEESNNDAKTQRMVKEEIPKKQTQNTKIESLIDSEEVKKIKELKDTVTKRSEGLSQAYLTRCAPCHGSDGKGTLAPSIAGKSKEELLVKLREYKENKIPNSLMKGLLINTPESELESLADEISKFGK